MFGKFFGVGKTLKELDEELAAEQYIQAAQSYNNDLQMMEKQMHMSDLDDECIVHDALELKDLPKIETAAKIRYTEAAHSTVTGALEKAQARLKALEELQDQKKHDLKVLEDDIADTLVVISSFKGTLDALTPKPINVEKQEEGQRVPSKTRRLKPREKDKVDLT